MLKDNLYLNVILYSIFIIYISFHKNINVNVNNKVFNIIFLILITVICMYNKTLGILLSIIYIMSFENNKDRIIYESFSTKDKNGLHDLNNVLKFLKTPKSKKVLETMFVEKRK
tara:strand:- start:65 stop:406 length:342 start_codon:yes stop_codon:yes gene_type:complete